MIGGSLYKLQVKKEKNGQPKIGKDGQPVKAINFGVAIAKAGTTHWAQTPWGALIRSVGQAAFGALCDAPTFAWKITDGDSAIPNKKGNIPNQQVGYPGHWVIWFSQGWAPQLCGSKGEPNPALLVEDTVLPGDWVQVFVSVKDNKPSESPGVYLNPVAVAFVGNHPEGRIATATAVDTTAIGFGQVSAPGAVLAAPVGMTTAAAAPPPAAAAAAAPPPPNPAFLAVPPAPPPARVMLPAAGGVSYEDHIKAGWNDALLIQHGKMAAA
jgi:hypothetical protein